MTKARWRHIFFILSLCIGIFRSTPSQAQFFSGLLSQIAGRVAVKTGETVAEQVKGTAGNIGEATKTAIKAASGDEEAQKTVGDKVTELVNSAKRGIQDTTDIVDGALMIQKGTSSGVPNTSLVADGLNKVLHGLAQSSQDNKVLYERAIAPILGGTSAGKAIEQLMEIGKTGQDIIMSDQAQEIIDALGNDVLSTAFRMLKNAHESVATGTGEVTYNGNCKLDDNTLQEMKDTGTNAAAAALKKLEDFKNGYNSIVKSGDCAEILGGYDMLKDTFNIKTYITSSGKQGAETIGGKTENFVQSLNGEASDGLAIYTKIDINNLAQKAANLLSEDSDNPKYKKCKTEIEKLQAVRGTDANTKDSFLYHLHEANNALSVVAVLSGRSDLADVDCTCERDEKGEETGKIDSCTAKNNGEIENNLPDSCKSVAAYMQDFSSNCFICGKFATILGAAQTISQQAFEATAGSFVKLLGLGLLLYIAYLTLITIASPEPQKLSKYLSGLLTQGFKVAIAILILQNPTFLYEKIITPILDGGLDFGLSLNGLEMAAAKELGTTYAENFNANSSYLSGDLVQSLTGTVHGFQNAAADVPGMGRSLICNAFHDKIIGIFPHITMLVNGIMLLFFGLLIMLAIGFYIFDCAVEMCLVCALMAFFVACWPFKLTSAYTRVGWNMLLNIFFNFVMMGIIVKAITELASFAVTSMGKDDLMNILDTGNPTLIDEAFELGGHPAIMVLICCLICLKLTREIGNLANKFASGAQIQIGAQLAGLAASAATAVAVAAPTIIVGRGNPSSVLQGAMMGAAAGAAVASDNEMKMLEDAAAQQTDAAKNLAGIASGGKGKSSGAGRILSSIAEHSGAKKALGKAASALQNKVASAVGKAGIGAAAEMRAKGRDKNANQKNRKTGF